MSEHIWSNNEPSARDIMRRIAWHIDESCKTRGIIAQIEEAGVSRRTLANYRRGWQLEDYDKSDANLVPATETLLMILRGIGHSPALVLFAAETATDPAVFRNILNCNLKAFHPFTPVASEHRIAAVG